MAEWHYVVDGNSVGPVSADDIEKKYRENVIDRDTLVWAESMPGWQPMHEVEVFYKLTRKSSPPPIPRSAPVASSVEPDPVSGPEAVLISAEEREQISLSNMRVSEPRIPWSRYFARTFDISVLGTLMLTVTMVVSSYVNQSFYLTLYTADPRALLLFSLPFIMVLNAIIITVFGNSMGKKIFGIHAVNVEANRPFTFIENVTRELRVWARGMALGIPFVNFFTMIPAYRKVADGKPTAYDEGISSVRPYSDSALRRAMGIFVTLLIIVGILVLNAIDKQHLERVSRPYTWTNPVTNIQTTIPGGWEPETMPGPDGTLYAFTNLTTGVVVFLAVEAAPDHTLVSYADALETTLSRTMDFEDWDRYDLPDVWKRNATMKEGNRRAAVLLRRVDSNFWRVVYVDQLGSIRNQGEVEKPELTRALYRSVGVQ